MQVRAYENIGIIEVKCIIHIFRMIRHYPSGGSLTVVVSRYFPHTLIVGSEPPAEKAVRAPLWWALALISLHAAAAALDNLHMA